MNIKKHIKTVAIITSIVCLNSQANAAGFALTEASVTGQGRAFAGAGIVGDDYSAIAFNPAGMTLMGNGGQIGGTVIWQHGEVKGYENRGTIKRGQNDVSIFAEVPNAFVQYNLDDSISLGLGVYAPFGLSSEYDDDFFASDQGVTSALQAIDIAPSIAYKVNDKWSVGASFIARWGHMELTNTIGGGVGNSEFDMDGWNMYGRFGVMYEHTKDTRFGLSYSSQSTKGEHSLRGDHEITGSPITLDGKASTFLPEQWLLSAFHKQGKFGYSGAVKYTKWECFDYFTVESPALPGGKHSVRYDWENTWMVSAGLDWYYNDKWTWRAGVAFDESPVRSAALRTTRIPDNDRYWMSFGFTYKIDEKTKFDFGYTHLYLPTFVAKNGTSVGHTSVPTYAKYDVNAEVLSFQIQFDF